MRTLDGRNSRVDNDAVRALRRGVGYQRRQLILIRRASEAVAVADRSFALVSAESTVGTQTAAQLCAYLLWSNWSAQASATGGNQSDVRSAADGEPALRTA